MKKKIFAVAVMLICISILASTTIAYFTDAATARNVITSGGISIRVVEQQLVGDTLTPFPEEPIEIMPGKTVSKIVSVSNIEQAAWVRVNYTVTVLDPNGEELAVPAQELEKMVVIAPNAEKWTEKDGWWYYEDAIGTGESSAPLFEEVCFSGPEIGNEYQLCKIVIDVNAQAVQSANNGETVMDAAGWSEE